MSDGKTYTLERIVDLQQVPADRREQCLKELLLGLALADLAGTELTGPMTWTDDGDSSCALTDAVGEPLLSLEVSHV